MVYSLLSRGCALHCVALAQIMVKMPVMASMSMQAKEIWAVGERERQKVWKEKKMKEMKETALRGLEPHLDTINDVFLIEGPSF